MLALARPDGAYFLVGQRGVAYLKRDIIGPQASDKRREACATAHRDRFPIIVTARRPVPRAQPPAFRPHCRAGRPARWRSGVPAGQCGMLLPRQLRCTFAHRWGLLGESPGHAQGGLAGRLLGDLCIVSISRTWRRGAAQGCPSATIRRTVPSAVTSCST